MYLLQLFEWIYHSCDPCTCLTEPSKHCRARKSVHECICGPYKPSMCMAIPERHKCICASEYHQACSAEVHECVCSLSDRKCRSEKHTCACHVSIDRCRYSGNDHSCQCLTAQCRLLGRACKAPSDTHLCLCSEKRVDERCLALETKHVCICVTKKPDQKCLAVPDHHRCLCVIRPHDCKATHDHRCICLDSRACRSRHHKCSCDVHGSNFCRMEGGMHVCTCSDHACDKHRKVPFLISAKKALDSLIKSVLDAYALFFAECVRGWVKERQFPDNKIGGRYRDPMSFENEMERLSRKPVEVIARHIAEGVVFSNPIFGHKLRHPRDKDNCVDEDVSQRMRFVHEKCFGVYNAQMGIDIVRRMHRYYLEHSSKVHPYIVLSRLVEAWCVFSIDDIKSYIKKYHRIQEDFSRGSGSECRRTSGHDCICSGDLKRAIVCLKTHSCTCKDDWRTCRVRLFRQHHVKYVSGEGLAFPSHTCQCICETFPGHCDAPWDQHKACICDTIIHPCFALNHECSCAVRNVSSLKIPVYSTWTRRYDWSISPIETCQAKTHVCSCHASRKHCQTMWHQCICAHQEICWSRSHECICHLAGVRRKCKKRNYDHPCRCHHDASLCMLKSSETRQHQCVCDHPGRKFCLIHPRKNVKQSERKASAPPEFESSVRSVSLARHASANCSKTLPSYRTPSVNPFLSN